MKSQRCHLVQQVLLISGMGGSLWAQSLVSPAPPGESVQQGLQIYSTTLGATYMDPIQPVGIKSIQGINSDISVDASVTLGWSKRTARSNWSVIYAPSYAARVHYSDLSTLNQSLVLSGNRRLSTKWALNFSGSAMVSSFDQSLFSPTRFGTIPLVPVNFDDLAAAALSGKLTNDQVASLLTGAPLVASPASQLLFGNRMFSSSLQTGLSYSPSARWSAHVSLGGSRAQTLLTKLRPETIQPTLTKSTSTNVGLDAGYSLNPRTQIGASVNAGRTFSFIQSAYVNSWNLFVGHRIKRLFFQASGGSGVVTPVGPHIGSKRATYLYSLSSGYRTRSHMLMASYNRSIMDPYGIPSTFIDRNVSWMWNRPGATWWVQSNFSQDRLISFPFRHVDSWMWGAGFGRRLTSELAFTTQYSVGRLGSKSQVYQGVPFQLSEGGVRAALVWTPQIHLLR